MNDVFAGGDSVSLDGIGVVAENEGANGVVGEVVESAGGQAEASAHMELEVAASLDEVEVSHEGEEGARNGEAREHEDVGVAEVGAYGMEAACGNGLVVETGGEVIAHAYGDAREDEGAVVDATERTYVAEDCAETRGAPNGGRVGDIQYEREVGVVCLMKQYLMKQKHRSETL